MIAESSHRVFVDSGLVLRGELTGGDHLAIAGHLESDVAARMLDIWEPGTFIGSATVRKARIAGRYVGALTVAESLVVGPAARISGWVQCGKLQVEDGGTIEGELRVLGEEEEPAHDTGAPIQAEQALGPEADAHDDTVESDVVPPPTDPTDASFFSARAEAEAHEHALEADVEAAANPPLEAMLPSAPRPKAYVREYALEAADVAPPTGSLDAALRAATAAEDSASLAEAEANFRSAIKANPCDIAALSGLGHLARQRGDFADALRYFESIMSAEPRNTAVRRVSIGILRRLGRHEAAAAIAQEAVVFHSPQSSAHDGEAADCEVIAAAFAEAEATFKSVLDRFPRNLGALAGLGHLARRRGDRAAMEKYYLAALAIEPASVPLRVEVARAFKEQGDIVLAGRILEAAPLAPPRETRPADGDVMFSDAMITDWL